MQARYQYGDLTLRKRKKGPAVWQYRYFEDGTRKSVLVGTVQKLRTRSDAERAIEYLRLKVNAQNPQSGFHRVTVGSLIDRYLSEEMPLRVRKDTSDSYRGIFKNWIRPKWGAEFLDNVKPLQVEDWLRTVQRSNGTKAHIRNLMHLLFDCALRWDLLNRNPIKLVRQSSRRKHIPRVITKEHFRKLLAELEEPHRTIVIIAACQGLRICEILGLKWRDVDWENLTLFVHRSVVAGRVYETKTEASSKPLPIDAKIAESLLRYRRQADYIAPDDYIFAGNSGRPRWQGIMLTDHIKPAAERAGIGKIGWHTFRHSYRAWLKRSSVPLEIQKELMRHANLKTTADIYGIEPDVLPAHREANTGVVKMLLGQ